MLERIITVALSEQECRMVVRALQELQMRLSSQGQTQGTDECRSAAQKVTEAIYETDKEE
ncbi:MAG: hypothetical protein H6822_20475 [Planctomycetaceae bacterium]|nr:hypothetical protein [Planctomycetales bacterium]MCB9924566.1 hypothetical protein [Planctomycetaceae bacterium]